MKITLPWPSPKLSPNARLHWSKKAKAVKAYRQECMVLARNAGLKTDWDGPIHLWVTFYPPDRRRRDADNVYASIKALLDGLADALRVNDHRFRYRPFLHDEVRPGGEVVVTITEGPEGVSDT